MKTQNLIKSKRYSIQINKILLDCIDNYCSLNKINEEKKGKIQILTGLVYEKQIKFNSTKICLSQKILRKLFNNKRYLEILKYCENSTLSLTQNANVFTKTARHYKIKNELFNEKSIVFYPNITIRYEKVLDRFANEKYNNAIQIDKFYSDSRVEIQNLFLNSIQNKFSLERLSEFTQKSNINNKFNSNKIKLFKKYFLCQNPYLFKVNNVDKNGRIYDIFTSCKREFRELIKDEYVEVDISNSHPFILGSLLKNLSIENQLKKLTDKLSKNENKFKGCGLENEKNKIATNNLILYKYIEFILKYINIKNFNKDYKKSKYMTKI